MGIVYCIAWIVVGAKTYFGVDELTTGQMLWVCTCMLSATNWQVGWYYHMTRKMDNV